MIKTMYKDCVRLGALLMFMSNDVVKIVGASDNSMIFKGRSPIWEKPLIEETYLNRKIDTISVEDGVIVIRILDEECPEPKKHYCQVSLQAFFPCLDFKEGTPIAVVDDETLQRGRITYYKGPFSKEIFTTYKLKSLAERGMLYSFWFDPELGIINILTM